MSDPKQYDDVIGMLTDQCHQYALEVERLKAAPHDDDTCPHLVVLGRLEAENARLKAEVERLKVEVQHLMVFCNCTLIPSKKLQAQVERLTKAGDAMAIALNLNDDVFDNHEKKLAQSAWNAAKEGKQP